MDDCRLSSNINKNRYRDVCPYDETRVRINAPSGDYINASFVNVSLLFLNISWYFSFHLTSLFSENQCTLNTMGEKY